MVLTISLTFEWRTSLLTMLKRHIYGPFQILTFGSLMTSSNLDNFFKTCKLTWPCFLRHSQDSFDRLIMQIVTLNETLNSTSHSWLMLIRLCLNPFTRYTFDYKLWVINPTPTTSHFAFSLNRKLAIFLLWDLKFSFFLHICLEHPPTCPFCRFFWSTPAKQLDQFLFGTQVVLGPWE